MIKKLFAAVMAMAMVVSVAPAKAALTGPTTACPSKDKPTAAVVNDYVELLTEEIDLETIKWADEFDFDGGEDVTIEAVLNLKADWNADGEAKDGETLAEALKVSDACLSADAKYLKGLKAGIESFAGLEAFYGKMLDEEEGLLTVGFEAKIEKEADALELLDTLKTYKLQLTSPKVEGSANLIYAGNVEYAEEMIEEIVEAIDEVIEIIVEAYDVELASDYYESFVTMLKGKDLYEETIIKNNKGETRIVEGIVTIDHYDWEAITTRRTGTTYKLEQLIKAIEEDDEDLNLDGSYEDYEEEVEHFMEGLEELAAASAELDELVEEAKDLAIAAKLGRTKSVLDEAGSIGGKTYGKTDTWAKVFAAATLDNLYDEVNPAEFEMVAEFVEFIEENFYTVTYTAKGSRWIEKTEETEYFNHLENVFKAAEYQVTVNEEMELLVALFANHYDAVARDYTGEKEYEVLAAYMESVEEAYAAVTTGIKGITVNNLNSKNIDAVLEAKDAYATLQTYDDKGEADGFVGNLTNAEVKAVKAAADNINVLYLKALFGGITTEKVTGWVELGNGNWDYYGEDGNVFTGWVAAGSNWYYVSNGHMLRNTWVAKDATGAVWYYLGTDGAMVSNTTVDGYYINANGEWVK